MHLALHNLSDWRSYALLLQRFYYRFTLSFASQVTSTPTMQLSCEKDITIWRSMDHLHSCYDAQRCGDVTKAARTGCYFLMVMLCSFSVGLTKSHSHKWMFNWLMLQHLACEKLLCICHSLALDDLILAIGGRVLCYYKNYHCFILSFALQVTSTPTMQLSCEKDITIWRSMDHLHSCYDEQGWEISLRLQEWLMLV